MGCFGVYWDVLDYTDWFWVITGQGGSGGPGDPGDPGGPGGQDDQPR